MTDYERQERRRAYDHAKVLARNKRLAESTDPNRFCNCCRMSKQKEQFFPSCETQCRACSQAKAAPRRNARIEYLRRWRSENPDSFKQWCESNKERRSHYMQQWREQNKEIRAQKYAKWARANPARIAALIMKRTAAKLSATPAWVDFGALMSFYVEAERQTRTTGVRHEVDHIVPLQSRVVCGLHVPWNLQVLTKTDNLRKGNRFTPHGATIQLLMLSDAKRGRHGTEMLPPTSLVRQEVEPEASEAGHSEVPG